MLGLTTFCVGAQVYSGNVVGYYYYYYYFAIFLELVFYLLFLEMKIIIFRLLLEKLFVIIFEKKKIKKFVVLFLNLGLPRHHSNSTTRTTFASMMR